MGTLDTCSFRAGRFCISPVKVKNKWFLENIRGHLFLWNSYHHGSGTEIEKTLVIIYHEIEQGTEYRDYCMDVLSNNFRSLSAFDKFNIVIPYVKISGTS